MFNLPEKARDAIHEVMPPHRKGVGRKGACIDSLLNSIYAILEWRKDGEKSSLVLSVFWIMEAYWHAGTIYNADDPIPGAPGNSGPAGLYPSLISLLGSMAEKTSDGKNWDAYGLTIMGREALVIINAVFERKGLSMRQEVANGIQEIKDGLSGED